MRLWAVFTVYKLFKQETTGQKIQIGSKMRLWPLVKTGDYTRLKQHLSTVIFIQPTRTVLQDGEIKHKLDDVN